jgi:hypothetical protein
VARHAVRIGRPVVDQMPTIFAEDWISRPARSPEKFYIKTRRQGRRTAVMAQAIKASRETRRRSRRSLLRRDQAAEDHPHQNAYFVPDKQIRRPDRGGRAGVEVKVMVPAHRPWSGRPPGSTTATCSGSQDHDTATRVPQQDDGRGGMFSTIGSIFDTRSRNANAEEAAFYDTNFAAKVEAMFQKDLQRCDEIPTRSEPG